MIDFRYHLVSIVAIFLALSLGLLLGSTELKPYVQRGLNAASKTEHNQIETLLGQKQQFLGQISGENQFALTNSPAILHDLLAGQRVVLVLAPGAPGSVTTGVAQAVQTAGATVTGQLQLQTAFFDTSAATSQKLTQIAEQYAQPAGLTLTGTAQAQASELLAHVIMTQGGIGQPLPGEPDPVGVQAVQALAGGGFLTKSGQPWDRATLAVVVIPATPPSLDDTNAQSQQLVTLAQQLNLAGLGTVVAGTIAGSGPGSAIDVMRAGGKAGHLTSVDNADYPVGQIVVAQSLAEREHGKSGSYGVTANASAVGPSPPPSPAPTVSPTGTTQGTASSRTGRPRADRRRHEPRCPAARPGAPFPARHGPACHGRRERGRRARSGRRCRSRPGRLCRVVPQAAGWCQDLDQDQPQGRSAHPAGGARPGRGQRGGVGDRARPAAPDPGRAGGGRHRGGGIRRVRRPGGQRQPARFRGHLGALARGEVTTGAVKLGGIGATGLVSAALLGGGPVDVTINAGLVAGSANLLNLFDLRPGRALKVALVGGALLAARPAARPAVAAPLGAAIALLPEDLGERAMLGDAGANALGALLGTAAAASLSRPARIALLAMVTGLTAASEVVSFTAVIERTPALRWLDMLGRRPVPAAPVPGRDDPPPAEPREAGATAATAPS